MSEAKHTPGPWAADDGDGQYFGIFDNDGSVIALLIDIDGDNGGAQDVRRPPSPVAQRSGAEGARASNRHEPVRSHAK